MLISESPLCIQSHANMFSSHFISLKVSFEVFDFDEMAIDFCDSVSIGGHCSGARHSAETRLCPH